MPAWLLPAAIAAGTALLGRNNKPATSTQTADPRMWDYFQKLWGQAGEAGAAPPNAGITGAQDFYSQMQNFGMNGMRALGGDAGAVGQLMNPFEQQVMDAAEPYWAKARAGAMNSVNDRFTRARAFGGSRQAVAQGEALAGVANAQANSMTNLRYQGFNDAMGRAQQMANFGMGGAAGGLGVGQYLQDRPFNMMRDAMGAIPGGNTVTQSVQSNPWATGLGTFASLWGMPGLWK